MPAGLAENGAFTQFWEAGGPWPPLALAVIVGVSALTVGLMLMYHGTSMSSSPLILCSVTGLLIGLALTVVLPQALERLMTVMPSERIFIIFISAPLLMFVWEHVILDHQHVHPLADGTTVGCAEAGCAECLPESIPDKPTEESSKPGAGWSMPKPARKPSEKTALLAGKASTVVPAGETSAAAPAAAGSKEWMPGWMLWALEQWALIMRLGAWIIHSFFDGIILGSSDPKPAVMLPLTLAILVCAMQDVAGMYIYFTSRRASRNFLLFGIIAFAFAFPVGAGVSLAAFWGQRQSEWVDLLRVALAGLFVYMALFEMAPPHAHGRLQNLKYALAFSFGLCCAYLADAFEESMHPHRQQQQQQTPTVLPAVHWEPAYHDHQHVIGRFPAKM
jgi:zinc transporter ZupT